MSIAMTLIEVAVASSNMTLGIIQDHFPKKEMDQIRVRVQEKMQELADTMLAGESERPLIRRIQSVPFTSAEHPHWDRLFTEETQTVRHLGDITDMHQFIPGFPKFDKDSEVWQSINGNGQFDALFAAMDRSQKADA